MDEHRLVERVRAGEPQAERELYDLHVDRVYRLAFRLTGEEDLARDATQEAFIRAFGGIGEFRGDAALSTWLYSITRTVALNVLRKVKRFRTREMSIEAVDGVADARPRAEPDLKSRLAEAVDRLPEKYRTVFIMHDVEGFKHHEIAGVLGIRVGTSKAQLSRARARLQEMLAPFRGEWAS